MADFYIISDNQFFALGAASLVYKKDVSILSPEAVLNGTVDVFRGVCFIYLKNKNLHRMVCQLLEYSKCKLIFLYDSGHGVEFNRQLSPRLWPAKLAVSDFIRRTLHIHKFINKCIFTNITETKKKRILIAAKGLDCYMGWVRGRSVNYKTVHNHYRAFVHAVGVGNVSVHSLMLSEYIAVAYATLDQIQNNYSGLLSEQEPDHNIQKIEAKMVSIQNLP